MKRGCWHGLEVRHISHGATQPLLSLNVWDLTPFLGKASPDGLPSWCSAEDVAISLSLAALMVLKDTHSYSSIRILTDCQSVITTLSIGPARQPDSVWISIWSHLSSFSKTSCIHIQWIPSYIGVPGNTLADLEAKQGSTLPHTSVPVDLATAKVLIRGRGRRSFRPNTNAPAMTFNDLKMS